MQVSSAPSEASSEHRVIRGGEAGREEERAGDVAEGAINTTLWAGRWWRWQCSS